MTTQQINFCACGSAMSDFEHEQYRICTKCHMKKKEEQAKIAKTEREEEERKKELAEKARKKERQDYLLSQLKKIEGKRIETVDITEFKDVDGDQEIVEISIRCEDGTDATIKLDDYADGCMGCYDYYYYLGLDVYVPGEDE